VLRVERGGSLRPYSRLSRPEPLFLLPSDFTTTFQFSFFTLNCAKSVNLLLTTGDILIVIKAIIAIILKLTLN
jgi:hypothetical protein